MELEKEAGLCEHFRQYRGRLVVSHLNIRSLLPKHDELQVYLERWKRASVVGMSESLLDKGVSDAELVVMGMRMYRKDRNRRGGGILVYVSEDVLSVRRWDLEDQAIEALWIEVKMRKRRVLICNLYRPPGARYGWTAWQQWLREQFRRRLM